MANMSYCRFNNTSEDLEDCFEALREKDIESDLEKDIAKEMLYDMVKFLHDFNVIDNYPLDVWERIEKLIV